MKKTIITLAILLGISMTSFGAWGGGLFQRGPVTDEEYYGAADYRDGLIMPGLPNHGYTDNQNAPLGTGLFLLAGLGAAYALKKRNKE